MKKELQFLHVCFITCGTRRRGEVGANCADTWLSTSARVIKASNGALSQGLWREGVGQRGWWTGVL